MALIAAHLNAGHSGGDSVAIGTLPLPPPPYPLPPFSQSLINLTVSVDVKHYVYFRRVGDRQATCGALRVSAHRQ